MIFAEFYHESTGWNGKDFSGPVKLIPACGSDSVLILDGRFNARNQAAEARKVCSVRKFKGFTLNQGETFNRSRKTRDLESVE